MSDTGVVTPTTNYGNRQKEIDAIYENAMAGATSARNETIAKAAKERDQGYESAGILYERMKKYLPIKQKIEGTSGMGMTATALSDIGNSYMNQKAAVTRNYNDAVGTANAQLYRAATDAAAVHSSATQALMGEQDGAVREIMTGLDGYGSREDALTALGLVMDTSDARYEGYKTTINEHFDERENDDKIDASVEALLADIGRGLYDDGDSAYIKLMEIYGGKTSDAEFKDDADYIEDKRAVNDALHDYGESSYADYVDEIDQMMALYANDPEQMQERFDEYLAEGRLEEDDIEEYEAMIALARDDHATAKQEKAREDFVTQLGILADSVLTTDEDFKELWDEYKDQLSPSAQKVYEKVIDTYVNDTSRDIARDEAERERDQYLKDAAELETAKDNGYDDVESYKEALINGEAECNGYKIIGDPIDADDFAVSANGHQNFDTVYAYQDIRKDGKWTGQEVNLVEMHKYANIGAKWTRGHMFMMIDNKWYMVKHRDQ